MSAAVEKMKSVARLELGVVPKAFPRRSAERRTTTGVYVPNEMGDVLQIKFDMSLKYTRQVLSPCATAGGSWLWGLMKRGSQQCPSSTQVLESSRPRHVVGRALLLLVNSLRIFMALR